MTLRFAALPGGGYRRGMSRPAWWIARALALAVILLVAACPKPTRRTLVPQVPTTGDAEARQRFLALREEFPRSPAPTASGRISRRRTCWNVGRSQKSVQMAGSTARCKGRLQHIPPSPSGHRNR